MKQGKNRVKCAWPALGPASYLLFVIGSLLLFGGYAQAQDPETSNPREQESSVKDTVSPEAARLFQKTQIVAGAPIPFVPFPPDRDPVTGVKIDPNAMTTLQDGTRVTWREAIADLNEMERKLNSQGASLRTPGVFTKSSDGDGPPLVISKLDIPDQVLEEQRLTQGRKYFTPTPGSMPFYATRPVDILTKEHNDLIKKDASRVKQLQDLLTAFHGTPPKARDSESFNYAFGDDDVVYVYLRGTLGLETSLAETKASVYASAGGALLGKKREVLRVTGAFTAPTAQTKPMTALVNFYLNGNKVYTINKQSNDGFSYPIPAIPLHKEQIKFYDSSILLGPFKVDFEAGVNFEAKIDGFIGLRRSYVTAQVGPRLNASLYGDAGLDLWIAKAGVSTNLTLLDESLRYGISQGVIIDDKWKKPVATRKWEALSELHALDGKAEVYIKQRILPWKKKVWSHTLFDWDGAKFTHVLWDKKKDIFLHDLK